MTRRLFRDLAPGDTFLRTDPSTGREHVCTVLEQRATSPADPFGRTFPAVLARSDDGREGIVPYGPDGFTETPKQSGE